MPTSLFLMFLHQNVTSMRAGLELFMVKAISQYAEQWLAYGRCSINTCWMHERMNKRVCFGRVSLLCMIRQSFTASWEPLGIRSANFPYQTVKPVYQAVVSGRRHSSLEASRAGLQSWYYHKQASYTCQFCCPFYTRLALTKAEKEQDIKLLSLFPFWAVLPLQQGPYSLPCASSSLSWWMGRLLQHLSGALCPPPGHRDSHPHTYDLASHGNPLSEQ